MKVLLAIFIANSTVIEETELKSNLNFHQKNVFHLCNLQTITFELQNIHQPGQIQKSLLINNNAGLHKFRNRYGYNGLHLRYTIKETF